MPRSRAANELELLLAAVASSEKVLAVQEMAVITVIIK